MKEYDADVHHQSWLKGKYELGGELLWNITLLLDEYSIL
jgi:hypothetical protein